MTEEAGTMDTEQIKAFIETLVRGQLNALVAEHVEAFVQKNELKARELSLLERIIRVEEEIKALREVQAAQFNAVEKRFEALQREMNARFEALQREMNARFEAMDKRFEAMDKRFEAMEKRFTQLQWTMGIGFTLIVSLITSLKFLG